MRFSVVVRACGSLFCIVISVLIFVMGVAEPHAHAASPANCVSPIPPPVPGTPVSPTLGTVVINEVLTNPHQIWNCIATTNSSASNAWVELYNRQDQPLDLSAVHASLDTGPNTQIFYLSVGSIIAPHGFLVVFPPVDFFISSSHTNSTLLRLIFTGTMTDQVMLPLPPLPPDQSYARISDGNATWQITGNVTIDASNSIPTPTPTLTPTPGQKRGRIKGSARGTGNAGSTTQDASQFKQIDGVQPAWGGLQMPNNTASSTISTEVPTAVVPSPAPPTNDSDLPRKLLFTLSATGVALALLWCWRLFIAHTST